jgi:hypothetical protein
MCLQHPGDVAAAAAALDAVIRPQVAQALQLLAVADSNRQQQAQQQEQHEVCGSRLVDTLSSESSINSETTRLCIAMYAV